MKTVDQIKKLIAEHVIKIDEITQFCDLNGYTEGIINRLERLEVKKATLQWVLEDSKNEPEA